MQNLFLLVIDEGQQYGTDREIAMISLLKQQPLIVWTGDSQQTPGGIARAAPNAKRSRQLLLAKKHGLRSDKNYYTPYTLADAMESLLSSSSNDSLTALADILHAGESKLGNVWTMNCQRNTQQTSKELMRSYPESKAPLTPLALQKRHSAQLW